jgi:electron transport complex protein RnfB
MIEVEESSYDKDLARKRFYAKKTRLVRDDNERQQLYREKKQLTAQSTNKEKDTIAKRAYIQEALARVKAKKHE